MKAEMNRADVYEYVSTRMIERLEQGEKTGGVLERELGLSCFPSPATLWQRYCEWKGITESERPIIEQDFYFDGSGKQPRYYQLIAINRTIEAIAKGQNRVSCQKDCIFVPLSRISLHGSASAAVSFHRLG